MLLIFVLLAAIVFLPTTMLVLFGMLPTVVAVVIDRHGGTRAITVGSMNLAGCFPFLLDLWTKSHTAEYAVGLITDPRTIIVIYAAAAIGYLIDWALSGIVATIMMQRANLRLSAIRKRQEEMTVRWGKEVTGEVVLDSEGFPVEEEKAQAT
ncbi:MAG: hypothetical protein HYS17_04140 [Micavibrio aeruginosavorus]|uniref:Uncharacterized protein n=1 Tax=Micavibrio aeruginosavorus TaxID=349221 RepID=A0A7T5R4I3_9BACT|nr:MAG: hypothetical protein HYS17_04140 [Micavibrio aeruginosavorus]